MRKTMLKSIKMHTVSNILLTVVCVMLAVANIVQNIEYHNNIKKYHATIEKVTQTLEQALDEQTDKYLELVKAEQPMKTNYPKKNVGIFELSFYTPTELGKPYEKLHTATNTRPKEGRTIAVDPKVIPMGSTVYIEGYGYYIAEDTGGAIKGNKIDIFLMDYNKAIKLGRPKAKVWILGKK